MASSFERAMSTLGAVQKAPGKPYLHGATTPGITSISAGGPLVDTTLASEETITYSIKALPDVQVSGGGARSDQMLAPGDLIFGTRSAKDPQVGLFELSHLNILLQNRWIEYQKLLGRTIKTIGQGLVQDARYFEENDFSSIQDVTLFALMQSVDYYPTTPKIRETTALPSQLVLHIESAHSSEVVKEEKARFTFGSSRSTKPPNGTDMTSGAQGMMRALTSVIRANPSSTKDLEQLRAIGRRHVEREQHRGLIMKIMTSYPDVTPYLTADGIMNKFNYLGIMVSSQDDTDEQTVQSKGGIRNINLSVRGPTEVYNRWGDRMIKGTRLYLILKRLRNEDFSWGSFVFMPYWSVVDQNNESWYGQSPLIGPVKGKPSRSNIVPAKELSYRDLSGRDALGHIIPIGITRYPENVFPTHYTPQNSVAILTSKATSLGITNTSSNDKMPINHSLREAQLEKKKNAIINVHLGIV